MSKELELSTQYKKSSDIVAIKDLMNKLNESLMINTKKLNLFEEDFFQRKNKINKIKNTIKEYNLRIEQLNNQKKQCFSQINRITREMAGDKPASKDDIKVDLIEFEGNLTNAEKIRAFQKKAKEIQSEIKDLESKRNQTQLKLEDLLPLFEIFEKDHQSLLNIISSDKKRIDELEVELRNKVKEDINIEIENIDHIILNSLRSSKEIKSDLEKIENELNKQTLSDNYFNPQNPYDLSTVINNLTKLYEYITKNESKIIISNSEKGVTDCLKQFKELETSLSNIESVINNFLKEINVNSQFRIVLSEDQRNLFINILFNRREKPKARFEELTTPEKIFFIIVFYLSMKLHTNKTNIIFSNMSLLNQYNKAGSIFRTIKKILPLFEGNNNLFRFKLIFILPNLELKKTIKNLKIITMQES
ncbi:MAG: hypothetical protein ACFFAV_14365 [Candidatus Hermodarchaeota archaeon]